MSYLLINFVKNTIMDIATYSEFRQNMKSYLDGLELSHKPLFIKRQQGEDVVVISKEDYTSLNETLYLLSSPANAKRLEASIKQYKSKKGFKKLQIT
jgi:antitoxin YefM